jgi:hypothetical protein
MTWKSKSAPSGQSQTAAKHKLPTFHYQPTFYLHFSFTFLQPESFSTGGYIQRDRFPLALADPSSRLSRTDTAICELKENRSHMRTEAQPDLTAQTSLPLN